MNGQTTRTAISTGTCVTFGIALSVALGVIPQANADDSGSHPVGIHGVGADVPFRQLFDLTQHAARVSHPAVHTARVGHAAAASSTTVTHAVQSATSQSVTARIVSADAATPATKHPKKKHHHKKAHHHKAKVKPVPKHAPRKTPSSSAVSSAITGLKKYVRTPFSPSSAQVADFGDQVCSAFDQNETLGQVEAAILAKVKQIPFTTVEAGAAEYVVKTAVKLYCPGYTSRLG